MAVRGEDLVHQRVDLLFREVGPVGMFQRRMRKALKRLVVEVAHVIGLESPFFPGNRLEAIIHKMLIRAGGKPLQAADGHLVLGEDAPRHLRR